MPLLMLFHSFTNNTDEVKLTQNVATEKGFMTMAMNGMGQLPSWNGAGSSDQSGISCFKPDSVYCKEQLSCDCSDVTCSYSNC